MREFLIRSCDSLLILACMAAIILVSLGLAAISFASI